MGATLPMRWKFLNDVEIFVVYYIFQYFYDFWIKTWMDSRDTRKHKPIDTQPQQLQKKRPNNLRSVLRWRFSAKIEIWDVDGPLGPKFGCVLYIAGSV